MQWRRIASFEATESISPPKMTGVDGTGHPINQLFHIWELEANRPLELRSGTKLQS